MGTNRNKYIHNVAMSVVGQIGGLHKVMYGTYDEDSRAYIKYDHDLPNFPQLFWFDYGCEVKKVVHTMGSAARGRILACGVAESGNGMLAYHEVGSAYSSRKMSGDELLTQLASLVVTAAIIDIIRAEIRHMRDEEQRKDDEFNRGMAAYIHGGPN